MMRWGPIVIPMGVAAVWAVVSGSSFSWASPGRAFSLYLAGFLWILIGALGTTLGRYYGARLPRKQWRASMTIALQAHLLPVSIYLVITTLLAPGALLPQLGMAFVVFFGAAGLMTLLLALSWIWGSPFVP